MSDVRGHVEGIPENQRRLADVGADMKRMAETHHAIAELVRAQASGNVPNTTGRGTGALAMSLQANADDRAGWIEHGTDYGSLIEVRYQYVGRATTALDASLVARYEQGMAEIVGRHP